MTGAGRAFAWFAGSFMVLVLLKDGTIPKIVNDGAAFLKDTAAGIKPITQVG